MLVTAILLAAFFAICLHFSPREENGKKPRRPPGPRRYPILGNLPQIAAADPFGFRAYHKLSLEYGEIMSIKVGLQEMVVLSSYEAMRALLGREELNGRLWTGFLVDRSMGKNLGIAFATGKEQERLKGFTSKNLAKFGFGLDESMESVIRLELEEMICRLRSTCGNQEEGGKVRMERFFQPGLLNVLWSMLAGVRYSHDDPKLRYLLEVNSHWFQSGNFGAGIVTAFPFLRFVFPEWTGYNAQKRGNKIIHDFLREMVHEHRQRQDFAQNPRSFIDIFLKKIAQEQANAAAATPFTDEQFQVACYDMFQAGFETTSNTLAFGLLFLVLNPHVQDKVYAELEQVVGAGNFPSMTDRESLPYVKATIFEVFRMSNILPISGPRMTQADVSYKSYTIRQGTAVAFNTYSVMRDVKFWGDPDTFRPERFLQADGQLNDKAQIMAIGFGVGKRSCLGQVLAQTTIFMFITTLLLNFRFTPDPEYPVPDTEPIFGIILSPKPYHIIVSQR